MSSTAVPSPDVEATSATRELVRALSLRDAIALVLTVIGTGVFLKTAPMAQLVGSPGRVMLAWFAAGLLSLAGALTYAELGAMVPEAGGDYAFLREAYGGLAAFLFGWTNLVLIATGGVAAVSTALASFLSSFIPLDAVWATRDFHLLGQVVHWRLGIQQLVAVAVILLFSAINARGVALGARVQWWATVAKLGGIAIIVLGAFLLSRTGSWQHLRSPVSAGIGGGMSAFGAAMLAALWAYQGWANVAMVAGEIEKPERNVPRALIFGMLLVIVVYLVTNLAYFYALPFRRSADVEFDGLSRRAAGRRKGGIHIFQVRTPARIDCVHRLRHRLSQRNHSHERAGSIRDGSRRPLLSPAWRPEPDDACSGDCHLGPGNLGVSSSVVRNL